MDRQQALKYDTELNERLQKYAEDCGEDAMVGKSIVEQFIEFLPDDELKGMVFLGRNPVSYKLGNARLDLKKAIVAGIGYVTSVSRPESIFSYIQLLIISVIFIGNATEQKLNGIEAYAVYLLHMKDAYHFGMEEEKFIGELQDWCSAKGGIVANREKVVEALNHLYAMKTADFEDGKISLREQVWGKMD